MWVRVSCEAQSIHGGGLSETLWAGGLRGAGGEANKVQRDRQTKTVCVSACVRACVRVRVFAACSSGCGGQREVAAHCAASTGRGEAVDGRQALATHTPVAHTHRRVTHTDAKCRAARRVRPLLAARD